MDQAGSSISPTDDEQESNDQTEQTAAQDEAPPELAGDIDEAPLELADDIQATALSNGDVSTESTWLVDESEGGGEPDQSLVDAREELPSILRSPDLIAYERERMQLDTRRYARRLRRYTLFVRRSARARRAAQATIFARATWTTVLILLGVIVVSLATTFSAASAYYSSEYTLIVGLQRQVAGKDSVRIYDDKGTLLYQINTYGVQHSITLANVPVALVNATVAVEDHDFWTNQGVSFVSIVRAAESDISSGQITQGGSTITQQLIKQQILTSDVTFTRKLDEAILAVGTTVNGVYSKRQILEMYLNSIPYSPTAYGIDAAAQEYFSYQDDPATGMSAAQHLDLAQASMLAGVPQNPNTNDPLIHFSQARNRQAVVLNDMVQYGYITKAQANAAWVEAGKPNFFHPVVNQPNLAPHFVVYIQQILTQMITSGQLRNVARSGLNVYTTLDLGMQNAAQQAINNHLYGSDISGYGVPIQDANVTNAAVLIANQHNGDIKVMLGSANYYNNAIKGQNNNITQAFRQPGSAFKPFVYATAFEKGWFPAVTVNDSPTTFMDGTNLYRPLDYNSTEAAGQVTLRTAIDWSLNIPAVKVMQFAGIDDVKNLVERMGVQWNPQDTWGLAAVLGSLDVTPFSMAQAYTVFANYGQFIPLHGIDSITDSSGNALYRYVVPAPVQVMDPRIAFLVTSMLSDNASRAGDFGACSPLYLDPLFFGSRIVGDNSANAAECGALEGNHDLSVNAWPTAAKTGTSQDFRNDWTMGYTMDYTGAVWVGNEDNTQMLTPSGNFGIDGITGAAPIWYHSMIAAEELSNMPKSPFPVPSGVQQMRYCSGSVCTTDWFLDNYNPPPDLAELAAPIPCVAFSSAFNWVYSSGGCQVAKVNKVNENIGAPPPVIRGGQEYIGALP